MHRRFICLFESKRKRQKKTHSICWFPPQRNTVNGWGRARSKPELWSSILVFHVDLGAQELWLFSTAFQSTLAESWTESGTARTQTSAQAMC